nr:MAG TPA: hypothetical protein [Caudoviricetes sp.]
MCYVSFQLCVKLIFHAIFIDTSLTIPYFRPFP